MSVISVEIRGLRRDAMSAAGFWHAFRSGLNLLVVSALATLAALLGMILTDDSAAATSTPLLASIMHAFVPTTHAPTTHAPTPQAAVPDEAPNPPAFTDGRVDAPRSNVMAAALGSLGVALQPPLDDRTPTASVASVTAEAFAAGAGSAGSGVHSSPVSSGGSGGLAVLLALGMLPDRRLPRLVCSSYQGRVTRISSRPLIRPG